MPVWCQRVGLEVRVGVCVCGGGYRKSVFFVSGGVVCCGGGSVQEIERQKERSARTAGNPTDQFVPCANRDC